MVGSIRKRLAGQSKDGLWDTELEFGGEEDSDFGTPTDDFVRNQPNSVPVSPDSGEKEYYTSVIRVALAQDGRLGKHVVSMKWLQAVLAELEGREDDANELWRTFREQDLGEPYLTWGSGSLAVPSYHRDSHASGPNLRAPEPETVRSGSTHPSLPETDDVALGILKVGREPHVPHRGLLPSDLASQVLH